MRFAGSQLNSFMLGQNPDLVPKQGIENKSYERQAATMSDATVAMGGMQGAQAVGEAEHMASAIRAEGAAAGQMAMADGIGSLASGIAGGFMARPAPSSSSSSFFPLGRDFSL